MTCSVEQENIELKAENEKLRKAIAELTEQVRDALATAKSK